MAEEGSVYELEGLQQQLQSLLGRYTSDELRADSKTFCSDFCKLVEEHASRWQVALPQLRILEVALGYFARASTFFNPNCDHVLHTLSSLALSVFELLLFFDQKDLHQEPLKQFTVTFQECHLALARLQNVHLLQVESLVRAGGPWASPALQAILSESSLPQSEVDGCISSELPVFFELRVRYLLSCERVSEAMALAKCCAWHPTAGQHLFFLQVYLTWLLKTSQHDSLHKEVADFSGKDAVHIICSLEGEEKDDLLLSLSRAFLFQQLRKGDMYHLCDLVFVWSQLHHRLKTSKKVLLEEIQEMMLSATNVNSIFPFIRAILQEVGEDGIQFCVELCVNALESCLPCDVITKSLIYKTIAGLLPSDLEVCRACALLVFFLERTVEAYKIVYLLYMHPDQEYHVEYSPIRNHVRFETLQVLKKDLYFDPEFWNLIALRTNCLKLMSDKVMSAALEEIMEDKWILSYCTKEPTLRSRKSVCQTGSKGALQAKKRHHKEDTDMASKRLKVGPGTVRRKGNQGSRPLKDVSSEPLRRSFWQLDRLQDNGGHRRTTRLSEKNPQKRKIRTPRWLLEDSGTLEENNIPRRIKRHGLRHQKHLQSSVQKRPETGQIKNNAKHKSSVVSHLMARENNSKQKGLSLDSVQPANPPQVILELSLPDNELMGTFIEDTCNRQRGFPQVLLYKPTVKVPATSHPVKTVHRKQVILRARDATMLLQQLHCYARRPKGKGSGLNIQGSVSTITRSSVQGSPPKGSQRVHASGMKGGVVSHSSAAEHKEPPILNKVQTTKAVLRKTPLALQTRAASKASEPPILDKVLQGRSTGKVLQTKTRELSKKSAAEIKRTNASQTSESTKEMEPPMLDKVLQCEESAVEMKVTIASQTATAGKVTQSPGLDKVSKAQTVKEASKTTTSGEVSQTSTVDANQMVGTVEIPPVSNMADVSNTGTADPRPLQSQDVLRDQKQLELMSLLSQAETACPEVPATVSNSVPETDVSSKHSEGSLPCENGISALTLVTEMVTELAPEKFSHKQSHSKDSAAMQSRAGLKHAIPHKSNSTSSCSVPDLGASTLPDLQWMEEGIQDIYAEMPENSDAIQSEESKLEYCCTFCNKVFKGSRVVAHAMFHYRRDECMFCGMTFKDDLLAMMHLSDHIEKLKRSKESAGNKGQENHVPETKDIATPETSAKVQVTNTPVGHRRRGRPRKSAVCPKSISLPDSSPPGPRKLRSSDKPVDGPALQENEQNMSKHLSSKAPVHKVNGHILKKKKLDRRKKAFLRFKAKQLHAQQEISHLRRTSVGTESTRLQENKDIEVDPDKSKFSVKMKKKESLKVPKTATKQVQKVIKLKNVEELEKVCCPVDSCTWFTDLSKNRVALLYHALEDHYGDVRPLKLAFRIGKSICSICMRVLWSFEHFQHHVERHRLTPRHPCLHQGCTARFKTGMEMRRHARKHSPLQAVCCLPGCSQLFICLWALNLHEREHYAFKSSKPDKNTTKETGDKHNSTSTGKTQLDHQPKDESATTTENKTVSIKATGKLRGRPARNSSTEKHVRALPSNTTRASLLKKEFKGSSETKDSHVITDLLDEDTSAQPTGPSLRLRHTLTNATVTNTALKSHKVISSSLLKHNIKVRGRKFKKKQVIVNTTVPKRRGRPPKAPKRRGRPPKSKNDENTTTGQNNEALKVKLNQRNSSKVAEISEERGKNQPVQDVVRITETSTESKNRKTADKRIKNNHAKRRMILRHAATRVTVHSLNQSVSTASADKTQKSTTAKIKKLRKVKKHFAPKGNVSQTASSDSCKSKKEKVTNGRANTDMKKKCPRSEPESALKEPAKSSSVVPQIEAKPAAATVDKSDEEGTPKPENGYSEMKRKCPEREPEFASKKPAKSSSAVPQIEAKPAAATVDETADEEGTLTAENADSTQKSSGKSVPIVPASSVNEITSPPTNQCKETQKETTKEESKKSDMKMKKTVKKEKKTSTASSNSHKTNKRHKDTDKVNKKTLKERHPLKDASKTLKKTAKLKSVDQQAEAKTAAAPESSPDVAGKEKLDSASSIPAVSASSSNDTSSPPASTEKNKEKAAKKEKLKKHHVPKTSDKANRKHKVGPKDSETKTVKKKCKDPGSSTVSKKAAKPNIRVKAMVVQSSAGEEGNMSAETQASTVNCPGYTRIVTGQPRTEDVKSTVCKETLAEYGKKPYMRPPPTAYLDERYTNMPKRRKDMLSFQPSQKSPEQAKVTEVLQRQRCANCFATFNCAEDLQNHLQQQKCSNLFGFDSDDEGNS